MFDKNFHHHDEQVLKLSLKIFSDPSSENLQIDKIFSNFPQKEEARLLYPNYIHFLELVLNEKTHTHKAFWTAFSKSYSQQENIHTTLKVDDFPVPTACSQPWSSKNIQKHLVFWVFWV